MLFTNLIERSQRLAARAVLTAGIALSATMMISVKPFHAQDAATGSGATASQPADANTADPAANSPLTEEWRQILQKSGSFITHARYGEVWKPSVTPESWHPYPACYWKFTKKFGWYFDDPTDWGQIVHHYGRWTNDAEHGWIWVPGAEFSPGWVVWRTSEQYIGWAPQMPDQDIKQVSTEDFNKSGQWIFMDASKFGKKCTEVLPVSQQPMLLQKTKYVTDVRYVGGIGVFVLPKIFTAPYVNIHVVHNPWHVWYFSQWVLNLNWFWTTIHVIVVQNCRPGVIVDPVRP